MTPQEAAEHYIESELKDRICESPSVRDGMESDFLAGQQWQAKQDNQALSSALKEIEDLKDVIKLRHSTQLVTLDQLNDALKEIAELRAKLENYELIISSDSVYTLLRSGYKYPSRSGADECTDHRYIDLYHICVKLKEANRLSPESNPEPDSANLPPEITS